MTDDGEDATGEADDPDAERADPFEEIEVEDREADPFAELGGPNRPVDRSDRAIGAGDPGSDTAAFGAGSGEPPEPDAGESIGDAVDETDPLSGFGPEEGRGDPFERLTRDRAAAGEEEPDEELWATLSESLGGPDTESSGQRRFAEVSKHSYCEGCEYFSKPPDVQCGHDGSDIIEFVDSETVRVADCPIVAEREELSNFTLDH